MGVSRRVLINHGPSASAAPAMHGRKTAMYHSKPPSSHAPSHRHMSDIECLGKVQQRATNLLVKGFKKYGYENRLFLLGLTTLEERRLRGDLMETYKILSGKERVNSEDSFHFSKTGYNLHGHNCTLATN